MYNCLIVGLGNIGMGYDLEIDSNEFIFTHAKAISLNPNFNLLGAVDNDHIKRQLFTKKFGVVAYENLHDAMIQLKPNIVIIAIPTTFHFEVIKNITEYNNIIAILCEKPISYNLAEAKLIIDMLKEKKISFYVNYIRRSDIGVKKILDKFNNGEIKIPIKGTCWYSKGLLHNGSHFLNILQLWLGKVESTKIINIGRDLNEYDSEPDFLIEFEKGQIIFLSSNEEYFPYHEIDIVSHSGVLNYMNGGEKIYWHKVDNFKLIESEEIENNLNQYQMNVYDNLYLDLNGKNANISKGEDAIITIENIINILNLRLYEI